MSTDWKPWIAIGLGVAVLALVVWGSATVVRRNVDLTVRLDKLQQGFEEFSARSDGLVADRLQSMVNELQEIRNSQTGIDSRLSSLENTLSENRSSGTAVRVLPRRGRPRIAIPEVRLEVKPPRAGLGVSVQDVTPELAKVLGLKEARGALITRILPESAAKRVGLRRRDVILRFDDVAVRNGEHLGDLVRARKPGDNVRLTLQREGKQHVYRVVLGTLREPKERLRFHPRPGGPPFIVPDPPPR